MSQPQFLNGINEISSRYDALVLDVWGVLHNGVEPYPGVVDALTRWQDMGKSAVLLSNAPMRADTITQRIVEIGMPRALFGAVMSSGEEVWRNLRDRRHPDSENFYATLGDRCLWLGPERHRMVDCVNLTMVTEPAEADFILNTGPDELDDAATAIQPLLRQAATVGLPMICANADLYVVHGGTRIVCAGRVAEIYEAMGGEVRWHGKPFASIYRACLALLEHVEPARILAVGDSLRTDIQGAANAGLDSLLVTQGVHAELFGHQAGAAPDEARIRDALADGPMPTYVGPGLVW